MKRSNIVSERFSSIRTLAGVLALGMSLLLVGCAGGSDANDTGSTAPVVEHTGSQTPVPFPQKDAQLGPASSADTDTDVSREEAADDSENTEPTPFPQIAPP